MRGSLAGRSVRGLGSPAKIAEAMGEVKGKTIGLLGLAFKPETDDMRDSPAITIIEGLQKLGARIRAYDPEAMERARTMFEGVKDKQNLKLTKTRAFGNGNVFLCYEPMA